MITVEQLITKLRYIIPLTFTDKVTFKGEVEPQEEYDDVILPQTVVSERKENFHDAPDPSSDPPLRVSIDEVKDQKDE